MSFLPPSLSLPDTYPVIGTFVPAGLYGVSPSVPGNFVFFSPLGCSAGEKLQVSNVSF